MLAREHFLFMKHPARRLVFSTGQVVRDAESSPILLRILADARARKSCWTSPDIDETDLLSSQLLILAPWVAQTLALLSQNQRGYS
jgi:hypothetical protein